MSQCIETEAAFFALAAIAFIGAVIILLLSRTRKAVVASAVAK